MPIFLIRFLLIMHYFSFAIAKDISFDEVDVNSFQSVLSDSDAEGILSKTKSAGFIIRVVLDELEKKDAFETVSDMR